MTMTEDFYQAKHLAFTGPMKCWSIIPKECPNRESIHEQLMHLMEELDIAQDWLTQHGHIPSFYEYQKDIEGETK